MKISDSDMANLTSDLLLRKSPSSSVAEERVPSDHVSKRSDGSQLDNREPFDCPCFSTTKEHGYFAIGDLIPGNLDGRIVSIPTQRTFSFSELANATRNFKPYSSLGKGRFGEVYRGMLYEKVTSKNSGFDVVAVKKLNYQVIRRFGDWQSVVSACGGLSHGNLVKLLGYCWEHQTLYLVHEYMPQGSLGNHLFRLRVNIKDSAIVQPLPWSIRLNILLGAARGLAYLHTSGRPIICKKFMTSNILLDDSFNPKLSDFGYGDLDDCVYVPTPWPGTAMGEAVYDAPEYIETGRLGMKGDVYSFGVVVIEMVTGLRASDWNHPRRNKMAQEWFAPYCVHRRKLARVMDSGLEGEYPPKAAMQLAALALQCLGHFPRQRPSMKRVVEVLEQVCKESYAGLNSEMVPQGKRD